MVIYIANLTKNILCYLVYWLNDHLFYLEWGWRITENVSASFAGVVTKTEPENSTEIKGFHRFQLLVKIFY